MRGILPEAVLKRPKTGLASFPVYEYYCRRHVAIDLQGICNAPFLEKFVDIDRFMKIAENPDKLLPEEYILITRPLSLAIWLQNLFSGTIKPMTGGKYEHHQSA